MELSDREKIELFHLLFLRQLVGGSERALFTLKGGVNLRFFFGSIRYSEDMDIDVHVIAKDTLKQKVDRLLRSPALTLPLKSQGLELVDVSAPKQTDTTQRWKLGLMGRGASTPTRTKVEFSRRPKTSSSGDALTEPVNREAAAHYGMSAPVVQHYGASAAVVQKVRALVGRPQTQARDVFDLHLLRAQATELPKMGANFKSELSIAVERSMSLSYEDYLGQVVAYFVPGQGQAFSDKANWEAMQLDVIQYLEELAS